MAEGRPVLPHRLFHFAAFGSTTLLLILIAETPSQEALAAVGVALLGVILECGQYSLLKLCFLEWWDIRDDAIASLVVFLCTRWRGIRHTILQLPIS